MCGRYYLADDILFNLKEKGYKLSEEINENKLSTIYPSQSGLYLGAKDKDQVKLASWGFPMKDSSKLVINARSESVTEKPMFKDSFYYNRILIVMSGFFEWNKIKEKYTLSREDKKLMYVGGILRVFNGKEYYVMLTTEANGSMDKIHSRMPLIIEEDMIEDWLFDEKSSKEILKEIPKNLIYKTDSEQLSFL